MGLAGTLMKSGLAVAGAGIFLFFRRLVKKVKKTEEKIEEKLKTKKRKATSTTKRKKTAATKTVTKPRQKTIPPVSDLAQ